MAIHVLEGLLVAQKSLSQRDVHVHVEIILNALKCVVCLLLKLEDQVSCNHVWHLFTLLFKYNLLIICHSLCDIDFKFLFLLHRALSTAYWAHVSMSLTLTIALCTWLLHLHDHHSHVNFLDGHTLTLANWASFEFSALGSRPSAFK